MMNRKRLSLIAGLIVFVFFIITHQIANDAERRYNEQLSLIVYDRHQESIRISENSKGHYILPLESLPNDFKNLLIKKEDRFFYFHPGLNPASTARALVAYIKREPHGGASTITQQLAKNLLHSETRRTLRNKLTELIYAVSLEVFHSKDELLVMYANSVYMGNQVQGFDTASHAYFDKPLSETTMSEQLSLLATLSYPSTRNPWASDNTRFSRTLQETMSPDVPWETPNVTDSYQFQSDTNFELRTAGINCKDTCQTTVDKELTEKIRSIVKHYTEQERTRGARNAAVVVIDPKTNEMLALIGSKDPQSTLDGDQINMAVSPRPIGSTIKPFIYLKGFEKGLRPYSVVDDREYKYPIATGEALYPKNFDGKYRGEVTLHEALSNSLNVPTVKVLEYVGLDDFYNFMSETLAFSPIQDWDSYQYGIALGGLEMDLLTLTHLFTTFPNQGELSPLSVGVNHTEHLPYQTNITSSVTVADSQYVELVHAILRDRLSGVEQFGLVNNLTLPIHEYGVKTGTSRDFHDSWVVGYTPDFVVGVWLGNTENEALAQITGQSGAGAIWHDVMELLINSDYYTGATIETNQLVRIPIEGSDEWGLPTDIPSEHTSLLTQDQLITSPHEGDIFALTEETIIPLRASEIVTWSINGEVVTTDTEAKLQPTETGNYEIMAELPDGDRREIIIVTVTQR